MSRREFETGKSGHAVCTYGLEILDMNRAMGHATSGFRSKLHSRAESLSLESLEIRSTKSGHESRRGSRKSGHTKTRSRKSRHGSRLDTDFCDPFPDFRDQILVCPDFRDPSPEFRDQIFEFPDFRDPRRDSFPDFPDSNSQRDYAIWD